MSLNRLIILTAMFVFGGAQSGDAGFSIGGTTTSTGFSYMDPAGSGQLITFRASNVTYVSPSAAGDALSNTLAMQIPGWTISYGGALAGSLNVTSYASSKITYNDGSFGGSLAMKATYTPAASDPAGLTFIQYYTDREFDQDGSNSVNKTVIDNGGSSPPPSSGGSAGLPTYYSPNSMATFGLQFRDTPSDPMPMSPNYHLVMLNFYTYMCTYDANAKTITVYDGWHWGYATGATMPFVVLASVPEPASALGLVVGLTVALLAGRREKPK